MCCCFIRSLGERGTQTTFSYCIRTPVRVREATVHERWQLPNSSPALLGFLQTAAGVRSMLLQTIILTLACQSVWICGQAKCLGIGSAMPICCALFPLGFLKSMWTVLSCPFYPEKTVTLVSSSHSVQPCSRFLELANTTRLSRHPVKACSSLV